MEMKSTTVRNVNVISIVGRLDSETSGMLSQKLLSELKEGRNKMVLDLAGLEYISSAGLRVILEATKKAMVAGGNLYFANIQENVAKVLNISGFSSFLKISKTLDEAVSQISK